MENATHNPASPKNPSLQPTKELAKPRTFELPVTPDLAKKPQELIQIRMHDSLSLYARRAITILWHNAHRQGFAVGKDYRIRISELSQASHKGSEGIEQVIDALMRTIVVIPLPCGGRSKTQVLGGNDMEHPEKYGQLTYSFDRRLVEALQHSTIWGKISLPVLMKLRSKYAIPLYEHICQLRGLRHKSYEDYSLAEFKLLLGVEETNYGEFGVFNRDILKKILLEINEAANFVAEVETKKTGRKVTGLRLSWYSKV